MLDDIKPTSKLGVQLRNLGVWLQNNSSSKTGNVKRTYTTKDGKITVTVRPSGVVGLKGYTFNQNTYVDVAYGKASVSMYSRGTGRNVYLPKNRAAAYLNNLLSRMIPGIPVNVTRNNSIHL